MSALRTLGDWLDQRTAWRSWGPKWLDHPLVGGRAGGPALAASVATCFGVLALTGLLLMTAYAPAPQAAWASVYYVQFMQPGGWVVRGLHYWAAQSLFVLAAVHVAHGALTATYRKPGEIGWWLTLVVLLLAVVEGITGGLLPWDELGWWARVVEGNIAGLAPVIGGFIQQMIAGGSELGALGLTRAFTLHVMLLPPLIALALVGRRPLARDSGPARPRPAPPPPRRCRPDPRRPQRLRRRGRALRRLHAGGGSARRAARRPGQPPGRLPGAAGVVSAAHVPAAPLLPRRDGVLGHVARARRRRGLPRDAAVDRSAGPLAGAGPRPGDRDLRGRRRPRPRGPQPRRARQPLPEGARQGRRAGGRGDRAREERRAAGRRAGDGGERSGAPRSR